MTDTERAALRRDFILSANDVPLTVDEARALTGWSETKLLATTIPRGKDGNRTYFMKSQLVLWLLLHTNQRLDPSALDPGPTVEMVKPTISLHR